MLLCCLNCRGEKLLGAVRGCRAWLLPEAKFGKIGGEKAHSWKDLDVFVKDRDPWPKGKQKRPTGCSKSELSTSKQDNVLRPICLPLPNVCSQQEGKSDQRGQGRLIPDRTATNLSGGVALLSRVPWHCHKGSGDNSTSALAQSPQNPPG